MPSPLTRREEQILTLGSDGVRLKEMSPKLGISVNTIKTYLTVFHRKYGTGGMTEAVALALRNGWIE